MNSNKFIKWLVVIVVAIIFNIIVFLNCNLNNANITLSYKLISSNKDVYQLFYDNDKQWKEEKSQTIPYIYENKKENLKFSIPKESRELRFDFGNQIEEIQISDLKLSYMGKNVTLDMEQLKDVKNQTQIEYVIDNDKNLKIKTSGNDPYITYEIDENILVELSNHQAIINNIFKIILCFSIDLILYFLIKNIKFILQLIRELKNSKSLIWSLSKNDFKTKYAGSYLGIFWAFIQPVITVITYWFVFQVGFKSQPISDFPFLLWLVVGLVPWFFFSEAIINATSSMIEYSYLVKKVLFKISILPIVKIMSAFFVHLFFVIFTIILFGIYGYYPDIHVLQIIYYTLCTFVLVLGISYATSAIIVFFKDLGQIVSIILQIGIWLTPIMWSDSIIPSKYKWIFKLNPMYYIVQGYRDSFINKVWIWERYNETVYFWILAITMFIFGSIIFKKLKLHFADVL